MRALCLHLALLAALLPRPAAAYEGPTTHVGLTTEAMLGSNLHAYLRQRLGHGLGLFTRLELKGAAMDTRVHRLLQFDLEKLDPAGGYRPDAKEGQFAGAWSLAGSVLAEAPASRNRHHFYCPADGQGLKNPAPALGWFIGLLATIEGADTVRKFFTGTAFDLTGMPATEWLLHKHNPHSVAAFYSNLAASVSEASPARRRHHLALAMMALGGTLHLLQDMASPTHVRNDFASGHLQKLGSSTMDRGPAYERFVAQRFGQHGLPPKGGEPVTRPDLRSYFHSAKWDGLADLTHLTHFSPGTLPAPQAVRAGTGEALAPALVQQKLSKSLRYQKPAVGAPDLACAARQTCYLRGPGGDPLAAYRVGARGKLRFRLDDRVHAAAARRLLPMAARFSTGFINHLLRGEIELALAGPDSVALTNRGPAFESGRVRVMAEDDKGSRTVLADQPLAGPLAPGAALAPLKVAIPKGTISLVGLVEGVEKGSGDPALATVILKL